MVDRDRLLFTCHKDVLVCTGSVISANPTVDFYIEMPPGHDSFAAGSALICNANC